MFCHCVNLCSCAKFNSFVPYYQKLLGWLRPARVFEWGPGLSTNMALAAGADVLSIEPVQEWADKIEPHPRLKLIVASTDSPDYLGLHGWEDADVFFVDCRRRAECLDLVRTRAKKTAVVCLHDAQRFRYQEAVLRYKLVWRPDPSFCVLSMGRKPIPSLMT